MSQSSAWSWIPTLAFQHPPTNSAMTGNAIHEALVVVVVVVVDRFYIALFFALEQTRCARM